MNGYGRDASGAMIPVARPGEKDLLAGWIADRSKPADPVGFVASLRRLPVTTLLTLQAALQPAKLPPDSGGSTSGAGGIWNSSTSEPSKVVAALLSPDEVDLVGRGQMLYAIKSVRSRLGISLRAAKDVVDLYRGQATWPLNDCTIFELREKRLLPEAAKA